MLYDPENPKSKLPDTEPNTFPLHIPLILKSPEQGQLTEDALLGCLTGQTMSTACISLSREVCHCSDIFSDLSEAPFSV